MTAHFYMTASTLVFTFMIEPSKVFKKGLLSKHLVDRKFFEFIEVSE